MNWFLLALKNTFNYKGRARRREYGWFVLISFIINFTLSFLQEASESLGFQSISEVLTWIYFIIGGIFTFTQFALNTRRLHDLGYSGYWQILWWVIALLFGFTSMNAIETEGLSSFTGIVGILFLLFTLGVTLWLLFKDGQRFTNKYGEDPKTTAKEVTEI